MLLRKQSPGWLPLARHQLLCARVCSVPGSACDTPAPWGHRQAHTVQQMGTVFVCCAYEKLVHAQSDQRGPFISASWCFTGVVISGTVSVVQCHSLTWDLLWAVFVLLSLSLLCACSFWEPFANSLPSKCCSNT